MRQITLLFLLLLSAGCGMSGGTPPPAAPPPQPRSALFVNRIWQVAPGSDIPAGALYVFLSDNTLLITSPNGTPAIGRWLSAGEGITMIEEGLQYRTEIVELGPQRFVIRQHNPGGAVGITFVPAVVRR